LTSLFHISIFVISIVYFPQTAIGKTALFFGLEIWALANNKCAVSADGILANLFFGICLQKKDKCQFNVKRNLSRVKLQYGFTASEGRFKKGKPRLGDGMGLLNDERRITNYLPAAGWRFETYRLVIVLMVGIKIGVTVIFANN